jgi:hypothetical protein
MPQLTTLPLRTLPLRSVAGARDRRWKCVTLASGHTITTICARCSDRAAGKDSAERCFLATFRKAFMKFSFLGLRSAPLLVLGSSGSREQATDDWGGGGGNASPPGGWGSGGRLSIPGYKGPQEQHG